ncbi:MAG: hypothetical protein MI867_25335 [Pseudomonadales bacterium]|nr:hypothetical protein [Pseudomonadales bacterium]
MNNSRLTSMPRLIALSLACFMTSAAQSAQTIDSSTPQILSAYFGIDEVPVPRSMQGILLGLVCGERFKLDGMPMVINHEIDQRTLHPLGKDLQVVTQSGKTLRPRCSVLLPANDEDEDRTILMLGELGDKDDPPIEVRVVGSILTEPTSHGEQYDLNGLVSPLPITLEEGPSLVLAEPVPLASIEASNDGRDCPIDSTQQIIRLIWDGGITQFNNNPANWPPGAGEELAENEYKRIWVTVENTAGEQREINPFYIGDRDDGDNNNELCLNTEDTAISVRVEANTVTDPDNDFNAETSVVVSY